MAVFCLDCSVKSIASNVLCLQCSFSGGSANLAAGTASAFFGIPNLVPISCQCFLLFSSHCRVNIIFGVQREAFKCMLAHCNGRNPRNAYLSRRNTAKFSTASHECCPTTGSTMTALPHSYWGEPCARLQEGTIKCFFNDV